MSRPAGSRRSGRALLLRRVLPVLVVALLAGLVLVLTVGGDRDAEEAAPLAAPGTAAPSDEDVPEPGAQPAEVTSPATESVAAPVVVRQGVPESARTVEASRAGFTEAAEWSDGASVRVVEARQRVTDEQGPGALAGQPQTVFTLELTNGSDTALDLDAVVVQATYGSAPAQASPLYDEETRDFGGDLEPGGTATAVYSFAVPADQLADVGLSVDVDGHRFPAVFSGPVPVR